MSTIEKIEAALEMLNGALGEYGAGAEALRIDVTPECYDRVVLDHYKRPYSRTVSVSPSQLAGLQLRGVLFRPIHRGAL